MPTKLPSFQFYPGDWMKDPALRSVTLAARGLWADMLCMMFESPRRGYLQHITGTPMTDLQIARITGCSPEKTSQLLKELETPGVFSRENGVIYCRRMSREEAIRRVRSESGLKGGNPNFQVGHPNPYYQKITKDKQKDNQKITKNNLEDEQKNNLTKDNLEITPPITSHKQTDKQIHDDKDNQKITPSSSSSSSSSSSKTKTKTKTKTLGKDKGCGEKENPISDQDPAIGVLPPEKSARSQKKVAAVMAMRSPDSAAVGSPSPPLEAIEVGDGNGISLPQKVPKSRFVKPLPEQVTEYAKTIGFTLNGQQFCDFYESKGWQVGRTPMKNWQAAVRTWKIKHQENDDNGHKPDIPQDVKTVILGYKTHKAVPRNDLQAWWATYAPRYVKPATALLNYFGGQCWRAVDCIQAVAERMKEKGLDWGWQAIMNYAPEFKMQEQEQEQEEGQG